MPVLIPNLGSSIILELMDMEGSEDESAEKKLIDQFAIERDDG